MTGKAPMAETCGNVRGATPEAGLDWGVQPERGAIGMLQPGRWLAGRSLLRMSVLIGAI